MKTNHYIFPYKKPRIYDHMKQRDTWSFLYQFVKTYTHLCLNQWKRILFWKILGRKIYKFFQTQIVNHNPKNLSSHTAFARFIFIQDISALRIVEKLSNENISIKLKFNRIFTQNIWKKCIIFFYNTTKNIEINNITTHHDYEFSIFSQNKNSS